MSKDIISKASTSQTSDILIYKALKNSKHPLLKKFKIEFPSEGALAQESNTIFVMNATEDFDFETTDSEHYKVLTEIYVKTKKADYKATSKLLRTTIRAIKNVLKKEEKLKRYKPIFRNSSSKYASQFALKAKNLLVQTNEMDTYEYDDEDYSEFDVFFDETEIKE